jgi:carbamoyl-phosphate synthase large subunit
VKFPGVDVLLGPEMRSTGEVMGIDRDFARAFAEAEIGGGTVLPPPSRGAAFLSVKDDDKPAIIAVGRRLAQCGFRLMATGGTADALRGAGLEVERVRKVLEGGPHIVDRILAGDVALVFNTTFGAQAIRDSFSLRRTALQRNVPYFTTVAAARAVADALVALGAGPLEVRSLQEWHGRRTVPPPGEPRHAGAQK